MLYEYRVGTVRDGSDIVPATITRESELNITGLNLTVGKTYFIGGRAKNGAGLWSAGCSQRRDNSELGQHPCHDSYTTGVQSDPLIDADAGRRDRGARG